MEMDHFCLSQGNQYLPCAYSGLGMRSQQGREMSGPACETVMAKPASWTLNKPQSNVARTTSERCRKHWGTWEANVHLPEGGLTGRR